jgi:RND family efflux transporter MFP subunit
MLKFLKKYKLILSGIFLLGITIYFGQYLLNYSSSTSNVENTTSSATTARVLRGTVTSSVTASGQVQTANYLPITTSVNGIVKKVFVKEEDKVVLGQKIMEITLDSEGEKSRLNSYSSYLRAKNTLDSAKNSLITLENTQIQKKESFETLKENNSYQSHDERVSYKLAENEYLKAKSDYESQKAQISQLELALTNSWLEYQSQSSIITSPGDGMISNVVAVEGTKIENSVSERSVKTVASVKKEGTPIISLNVNELDISKIKVGQKAKLSLDSDVSRVYTGVVVGIDRIGSVSGGVSNYPVIVKFDFDSESVLPNMGVDGTIIIEEKSQVLYVPTSAISTSNGKKLVTVAVNGSTEKKEVYTGISDDSNTEIISGINEGDEVVITALPTTGFTSETQNRNSGGLNIFTGRR